MKETILIWLIVAAALAAVLGFFGAIIHGYVDCASRDGVYVRTAFWFECVARR